MLKLSLPSFYLAFFLISNFALGQTVGSYYNNNLTYLPDGTGVNYQTSLNVSGFGGQVVTSPSDLSSICVTMEHSYLGDLEMWLECPNGTQVGLVNSFVGTVEALPGGFNGGNLFLGDPLDNSLGSPGVGWEYCFSSNFNTWGDFASQAAAQNTVPSSLSVGDAMNPNGIYLPETSWTGLVGCPIDGNWTLHVRDNLSIDDGYIFGWGMELSSNLLGHSGFVFKDFNQNCAVDNLEGGIGNMTLLINPGNHVVQTNPYGGWSINNLPAGTYTVTVDTTTSWAPTCGATTTFTVTDPNVYVQAPPIGMVSNEPCAEPVVSIFSPNARPCMATTVSVLMENQSTASDILYNAYVEVELDALYTLTGASQTYTPLANNVFRFDMGDLYPGQTASIVIYADVDCQVVPGQTLCVEANMGPLEECMFDTIPTAALPLDPFGGHPTVCSLPYDGSSLRVEGWCQNDTVYFEVTNDAAIGVGDMVCAAPVSLFVDTLLEFTDSVLLAGGESETFTFFNLGQTHVMQVVQHPLHPGNSQPTAYVELCGNSAFWTPNIVSLYPFDDADPFVDVYCLEVTASYDPNDKRGFPLGVTDQHYISPGQQLDYVIRFQNTGTDTAFTVVIRDTLDPQLNLFTVNSGVSSHSYEFEILDQHVLQWTFDNILLPDSTTDEPGSQGFVTFTVDQVSGLQPGDVIRNDADIYFDFNPPIITNETWHTIYEEFLYILNVDDLASPESLIDAYPNPADQEINLVISAQLIGKEYLILDATGRTVASGVLQDAQATLDLSTLSAGYYVITLPETPAQAVKFIKR